MVFCLRYWRLWLTCDEVYSLEKNFISSNAYLSVEINAHSLLLLVRKCRKENDPALLLTWLYGSQQCESFFRAIRSLCPVGLNKPNTTEGEFLDRSRKAEANLQLQQQGAKDGVVYRRDIEKKNRSGGTHEAMKLTELPSDIDLFRELKKSQQSAKKKMNDLGIFLEGKDSKNFAFSPSYGRKIRNNIITETELHDGNEDEPEIVDEGDDQDLDDHDIQVFKSLHQATFKDFSSHLSSSPLKGSDEETPPAFVKLADSDGNVRLVRKSTMCWYLEDGMRKMSNDRILRVRQLASFADTQRNIVKKVEVRPIVRIGDWCLFKTQPDSDLKLKFLLGRVIQFSFIGESLGSGRKKMTVYQWEKGTDNIGVNCTWYRFSGQTWNSRKISSIGEKLDVIAHGFHPCLTYICSLPPPDIPSWKHVNFSQEVVTAVSPLLQNV